MSLLTLKDVHTYYGFSHVLHGIIFYWLLSIVLELIQKRIETHFNKAATR